MGWVSTRAPDDLLTLAERLREAGYQTLGISENIWVTPAFNMDQGFDEFVHAGSQGLDVRTAIEAWESRRDPDKPFFVFVNVTDAHAPYRLHPECDPPPGMSADAARRVPQNVERYFCSSDRSDPALAALRSLYTCEVASADAKLRDVRKALSALAGTPLVSVVTGDHGELFGEHRLVSHQFSVHDALLHVPLLVHGHADAPAAISQPVQHIDIAPSILNWAGVEAPPAWSGRVLPTEDGSSEGVRDLVSEYADYTALSSGSRLGRSLLDQGRAWRADCGEEDRVFGNMRTLIRFPFKLVEYERYAPRLFDLERDPGEQEDLSARRPELVEELRSRLASARGGASSASAPPIPDVDDEVLDSLRSLGYVGDE